MLQPERLFDNIFNKRTTTPSRLSNFAAYSITCFNKNDVEGIFKTSTAAIAAALAPFSAGLSEIDTTSGIKKGKTQVLNLIKKSFGTGMSDYEGEIARALGGRATASYTSFYPKGIMEYTKASKAQMSLLVSRINTLATDHAAELGTALTPKALWNIQKPVKHRCRYW